MMSTDDLYIKSPSDVSATATQWLNTYPQSMLSVGVLVIVPQEIPGTVNLDTLPEGTYMFQQTMSTQAGGLASDCTTGCQFNTVDALNAAISDAFETVGTGYYYMGGMVIGGSSGSATLDIASSGTFSEYWWWWMAAGGTAIALVVLLIIAAVVYHMRK